VVRLGAPAKCAPPVRDEKRRRALWSDLRSSRVQTIGSDHSPAPAAMKTSEDFFAIWGGIGGVQHGFELLLSEVAGRREQEHDFSILAGVFAVNVARRFGLEGRKGRLVVGHDADFTIWDFDTTREITADELWTQHRISAYVGRRSRARATHTFVRGVPVIAGGRFTNLTTGGKFVRPAAE
jgi:allantoinase